MRRIQLSPVIEASFLALALLATSCGEGNEPAARRSLSKGTAVIATSYTVGGTVTGLSGAAVVLQNNGADDLSLSADGPFTFATALADGSAYAVTVLTQPGPTFCTVASGSGTIVGADVIDVTVTCAPISCGGIWSGNCVVNELTGLLTGDCWSVDTCFTRAVLLLSRRRAKLSALRHILRAHCRQHLVQLLASAKDRTFAFEYYYYNWR
jgi:hypothetical protein